MNYKELFSYLDREYAIIKDAKTLPLKTVFTGGDPAQYTNILQGKDSEGYIAVKMIHVNEKSRRTVARILLQEPETEKILDLDGNLLTLWRTALNAAYAVRKTTTTDDNILFIGGGRINMMTAYILSEIGYRRFRLIGGHDDADKNLFYFEDLTQVTFNRHFTIDETTVVISCTNNNDLTKLYSAAQFPACRVHVTSDTGYSLDSTFRRAAVDLYSDCPVHLFEHHHFEFPMDAKYHIFAGLHLLANDSQPKGIYLYGNIILDILAARNREDIAYEYRGFTYM